MSHQLFKLCCIKREYMIHLPNGYIISPESVDDITRVVNARICVEKGSARAVHSDELAQAFYGGVNIRDGNVSRDFNTAFRERLAWAVENGHINKDNKFNDRKLRFDRHEWCDDQLSIFLGPSHFLEHIITNEKCIEGTDFFDNQTYKIMQLNGEREYRDPNAYLANLLAVNVVLTDAAGRIILGKRSENRKLWSGYWHNVGGFYDFSQPELFDGRGTGESLLLHFVKHMKLECMEEVHLQEAHISRISPIGITFGFTSVDINYHTELSNIDAEDVIRGHSKSIDSYEHTGFTHVSLGDLVDVLTGKKDLSLAARGAVPRTRNYDTINNYTPIVPQGLGGLLVYIGMRDQEALTKVLATPGYAANWRSYSVS